MKRTWVCTCVFLTMFPVFWAVTLGRTPGGVGPLTKESVEAEILARANRYLGQRYLVVDYYRIGRRLAFPLAFEEVPRPGLPVPGIPDYPWEIWLSWELEERINALGWAAEWSGRQDGNPAAHELLAVSRWPSFTPNGRLDLCLGHVARVLAQAYARWNFLDPPTRTAIGSALDRLVDQAEPWVADRYGNLRSAQEVLGSAEPHTKVHNIPFIGLIGASLAANARGNPHAKVLNEKVALLLEVLMNLRQSGYSEGVGYDGYLLDFVATWMQSLPAGDGEHVLKRFDFNSFLNESCILGAPGDLPGVAEIADVEPWHMPFHISAQARLQQLHPDRVRAWYLSQCSPAAMRADGLASLRDTLSGIAAGAQAPPSGILDAIYARVLRTGWSRTDLAVAVSASNSPAGHIHFDYGSVTIGTNGRWLIQDPGYQQYMPGAEREFTIGTLAHNAPILNGKAQQVKLGKVISEQREGVIPKLKMDVTACYAPEAGATRVYRTVWLSPERIVVIADEVEGAGVREISYAWHGSPDAAWRIADNWARLYVGPETALCFSSPSFEVTDSCLDRLPGSRGQLTFSVRRKTSSLVWWVFSVGSNPPSIRSDSESRWLEVAGQRFQVD